MSNNQTYKSISELTSEINDLSNKLELGEISFGEISEMLSLSRELTDRLVILRYKALENNTDEYKTKISREYQKFTDDQKKEAQLKEDEISKNQTSLIDAISVSEVENEGYELKDNQTLSFGNLLFDINDSESDEKVEDDNIQNNNIEVITSTTEELNNVEEEDLHTEQENNIQDQEITQNEEIESIEEIDIKTPENSDNESQEVSSLNETLSQSLEKKTITDSLEAKPIEDLTKAISINQKFIFINDLFNGDSNKYLETLSTLNSLADINEAQSKLLSISSELQWEDDHKAVLNFKNLVERRYL